jgi:ferredoxin
MTCSVDAKTCIRCAACATVAPQLFQVGAGKARVVRQPETAAEVTAAAAAAVLCPTQAIHIASPLPSRGPFDSAALRSGGQGEGTERPEKLSAQNQSTPVPSPRPFSSEVFRPISLVAEGVRWKTAELPWDSFDTSKLHPVLIAVAREMAFSEQTTFSATQRFMQAFSDDPDFSQWISVWFYEETRHPTVLLKWLEMAGEKFDAEFVSKGRVSQPFMKSRLGTLVTNVISEMHAAEAYLGMAKSSPEPLLAELTLRIAADEARHGASFFAYARRAMHTGRDRLDALKVLHFWVNENQQVAHPVNETMEKVNPLREGGLLPPFVPPLERAAKMVGLLTGLRLEEPTQVESLLREHTAKVHAEAVI